MTKKTYIRRVLISDIKKASTSSLYTKRISRAIHNIDTYPVELLCKLGKAKKVTYQDKDNFYIYRVNNHERLLFSITNTHKLIHDLYDANEISLLKRNQ